MAAPLAIGAAELGASMLPEIGSAVASQLGRTAVSAALTTSTLASAGYAAYKSGKKIKREVSGAVKDVGSVGKEFSRAYSHVTKHNKHHYPKTLDPS